MDNNVANKQRFTRKNAVRIKNAILNSIDAYPKTINEIALDIRSDTRTVAKYVYVLNDIGVIKRADFSRDRLWIKR